LFILFVDGCCSRVYFLSGVKNRGVYLPQRSAGAEVSSAVAVGLNNIVSGDIINNGVFDKIFVRSKAYRHRRVLYPADFLSLFTMYGPCQKQQADHVFVLECSDGCIDHNDQCAPIHKFFINMFSFLSSYAISILFLDFHSADEYSSMYGGFKSLL